MSDTIERELKYSINTLPTSLKDVVLIKQYYFNPNGILKVISKIFDNLDLKDISTYRFRIIDDGKGKKNILTLKTKGLFERNEYEKEVSDEVRDLILSLPIFATIIKKRYIDSYDNYCFEFDEYLNLNKDLYTVEIELNDFNDTIKLEIENILQNHYNVTFVDVTSDSSYKNANLIKKFGEKKI